MVGGYADMLKQFGLVDSLQATYIKKHTDIAENEIKAGNYAAAEQVANLVICVF